MWAVLAWIVLCVPGNVLSFATLSPTEARGASEAVIFGIIGLSLNVLIGYAGQISLGHQAFVGIGAFTSAYVVTELGQEFWLGVGVGGVDRRVPGPAPRRRRAAGDRPVLRAGHALLRRDGEGEPVQRRVAHRRRGRPRPRRCRPGSRARTATTTCASAFLALVLWLDWRLTKSKGGRALLALRENPRVAATLGINVRGYTVLAFVVSGFFAGIGGALFAHRDGFVVATPFEFQLALIFIVMTVVGGLRSRSGVVLGSAFFALLGDGILLKLLRLEGFFENVVKLPSEFVPLVIGPLLLLLTLTLYPGGMGQQIAPVREWLLGKPLRPARRQGHGGHDHGRAGVIA